MYPRVKVREQEDPLAIQEETTLYSLNFTESLSIEDKCSARVLASNNGHGTECRNGPLQSHPKISKCYPRKPSSSISTTKGKNNKGIDEASRTIIRASSVPRPRAVLSSPDNDGMVGNQNQQIRKRETLAKKQNQSTNNQVRKSGTPLRIRTPTQNTNARARVNSANAKVSMHLITRDVAIETEGKQTTVRKIHF